MAEDDTSIARLRHVPAALVGDPSKMTVLPLAGEEPVLIVAGPDARGQTAVSAVTEIRIKTLWRSAAGTLERACAGSVDLVAMAVDGAGRALALVPGRTLVRLDPQAEREVDRARRLNSGRGRLPARIFACAGGVTGLWRRPEGRVLLARLDAEGKRIGGSERAGPILEPHQHPALLLRDPAGRTLLVAEDARRGFQIWLEKDAEGWTHLSADGAARFGLNAGVAAAVLWGGRVMLAAGATGPVRQALLGMSLQSELIAIEPNGQLRLLAGELRLSRGLSGAVPRELMVPELSAAAIVKIGRGHFSHLAVDGAGRLILAATGVGARADRQARLLAIGSEGVVTKLADPCPPILGLFVEAGRPGRITAVVSEAVRTE